MNAKLVDPKLLRMFERLYATRSVTQAAELLGLSQPTVSIWLAQLRRELGDPLFVRTPEGMQPTPRAEALIERTRALLEELEQLSAPEDAFDPAASNQRFRILMTDAGQITLLPQLLSQVRRAAPGINLEVALIGPDLKAILGAGEAELALGYLPGLEAGFYQQNLFSQDWICLAGADHPRIEGKLSLAQYSAESHVRVVPGTAHQLLHQSLRSHGIERNVVLALPGFLGLAAILSSTDLVATLPRHAGETLAQRGGVQVLECPFAIAGFAVKQYWHARRHHDPANRWLRSVCVTLFQHGAAKGAGPEQI